MGTSSLMIMLLLSWFICYDAKFLAAQDSLNVATQDPIVKRILVIGDSGVGKTCLATRFAESLREPKKLKIFREKGLYVISGRRVVQWASGYNTVREGALQCRGDSRRWATTRRATRFSSP